MAFGFGGFQGCQDYRECSAPLFAVDFRRRVGFDCVDKRPADSRIVLAAAVVCLYSSGFIVLIFAGAQVDHDRIVLVGSYV